MQRYTSDQYSKIFWKLPTEIRDVISSVETTTHINIIGKKHNLQIDKIGDLVDITLDVIMGIVATKDFIKEIQNDLHLSALEASVLSRDIDENIFKPIKDQMVQLYAGRAPHKPSSSLVQYYEEDDEHPSLDKQTLLKEIEDPTPSEVKTETVVTMVKNTKIDTPVIATNKEKVEHTKPETEIVEYHQEISQKENKVVEKPALAFDKNSYLIPEKPKDAIIPNPIAPQKFETMQANRPDATNILNQIASLKLSQAFVMPKGPEGIAELGKLEAEQMGKSAAKIPEVTIPVTKTYTAPPIAPAQNISPEATPAAKIDPYRERI
ncbi:MAG: hypothetical protein V4469_03680 [Patescibacteria group bacterium]